MTFRLYAYRDPALTGGALTNTVALGRFDGPEIGGTVTVVPEPASLSLLAAGALFAVRRPRRK
ncbi:MAG TPA: PEP-CTERM sorting domain-containing protein [Tepidisphaeraceae bacterium]|nr:PEP-CTERM sorting domain-containing protein [Tepidisphaeraceae bacterium]